MTPRFTLSPLAAAASAALTALLPLLATPAWAQATPDTDAANEASAKAEKKSGQLQTVTVTAERRAANIQKTAIAMQAVSGAEITEQGLSSGSEILKNVSNVEVQGAARGNVIAMRGIGSDLPPGMGESAVSTNYDGVYNFRAEMSTLGFFDLARVEVLRGPQGTLYGRNAAAGAINYVTRDPVLGKHEGNASLEVGSHSLMRGELGFNLPISDTLALRFSGAAISRDGYLSDGFNDAKATGARVKLLYKPSADLRLVAGAERVHLGGKGPGFIPQANWDNADTRLTAAVNPTTPGLEKVGYQDYDATKLWAQLDWNLGFGTLTVLPAWQDASGIVYRRYDASRPPGSEEQYNADPKTARQKSGEVRLASPVASAVQWVAGAYWYDMLNAQECLLGASACAGSNNTRDTTTSKAAFGQVSVPLGAATRIVGGLRHTKDHKTAIDGSVGDWTSTDGKLGLEHDLAPQAMTYLTLSTAYRPGGFNTLPGNSGTFEAEKLRSLELGLKSRWLDNRLQLNGAVFRYDYKNYQAIDFAILNTGTLFAKFLNVPQQTMSGVEAEVQYLLPAHAGRLRGSFTWLDAKLGDLRQTNPDGTQYSLQGNPLPHAPRLSMKAGYEYPMELASGAALTLRADLRHTGKQYISITENANTLQPAYAQADVSASYRSADDKWGLNVYVKNLSNYVPKVANFVGSTMVGAPRTFGVVASTKF
ncbi:TonB-dependent receptor [Ideonella sp. DXS22W]|uniref:TonB-dependent receptor n=1 Tax=Pseudaquabacterium inlustre TaxID=2984192 RepID=A0ABU9CNV9_9BURK